MQLHVQHVGLVAAAPGPWSTGSAVVAHGWSCSRACGVSPGQGSNPRVPCTGRWPLHHGASREALVKRWGPSSLRSVPPATPARPVHQQSGPSSSASFVSTQEHCAAQGPALCFVLCSWPSWKSPEIQSLALGLHSLPREFWRLFYLG